MVDYLNVVNAQASPVRKLEHLNAANPLQATLDIFLISCRVDELSPRTIEDYREKISRFVEFSTAYGKPNPPDITTHDIRLFLLSLRDTCGPVSIRDYYGVINRFFNWMVTEGIIEVNPMTKIRKPRVPKKIIDTFTDQHITAMLKVCGEKTFLGLRNRAIILLLLDTGMRLAEASGIQLGNVDVEHGLIKVHGKGAKERYVAFGKQAQKALLKYLLVRSDDHGCLWVTEERRPMTARGIQTMIRRMGKLAELQGVRCSPHTFRHTFATRSLLNGGGQRFVQSLLGHSDSRMTETYIKGINSSHATEAHKKFSPVDNMKL